jgi:hypothetical protein
MALRAAPEQVMLPGLQRHDRQQSRWHHMLSSAPFEFALPSCFRVPHAGIQCNMPGHVSVLIVCLLETFNLPCVRFYDPVACVVDPTNTYVYVADKVCTW